MQGQDTQKTNVISLFETRKKVEKAEAAPTAGAPEAAKNPESFSDVMKQNEKNRERVEKERLNANKSVLRSYRIKH